MSDWTDAAKQTLEDHLDRTKRNLEHSEVDANDVIENISIHVHEEINALNLSVVQKEDVEKVLNLMGKDQNLENIPTKEKTEPLPKQENNSKALAETKKGIGKQFGIVGYVLFGILLPLVAVTFELATRICTNVFFDPLPTPYHAIFYYLIPLTNSIILYKITQRNTQHQKIIGFLNGVTIGVSLIYFFIFIPLLPLSLIGTLAYGIGLCGLSPTFALLYTYRSRFLYNKFLVDLNNQKSKHLFKGIVLPFLLLFILEIPSIATKHGMKYATSENTEDRVYGVKILRQFGDMEELHRACYINRNPRRADNFTLFSSFTNNVSIDEARKIYYRVTGKPFNSIPVPSATWSDNGQVFRDFVWDNDLGGDTVGGKVEGLSLKYSRQDGLADPSAVLGYTEWTMIFKNKSLSQREARAVLALPHKGVVSRLTLWVNGEPREAAFAKRSIVKQAYKNIVRQRRDPVLVTTIGNDRILMQCFPVPANGEMKIRIGISFPLDLNRESGKAIAKLPFIHERNFSIPESFKHEVWMESKGALSTDSKNLKIDNTNDKSFALRGEISTKELANIDSVMKFDVNKFIPTWSSINKNKDQVVIQNITKGTVTSPTHIALVVDGSKQTAEWKASLANIIKSIPNHIKVNVIVAADQAELLHEDFVSPTDINHDKLLDLLDYEGGMDNIPALIEAWNILASHENSIIVWLQNMQPVELRPIESLMRNYERRHKSAPIYSYQTDIGPNYIQAKFDGRKQFKVIPNILGTEKDMSHFFSTLGQEKFVLSREIKEKTALSPKIQKTSRHLVNLWARDQVYSLYANNREKNYDKALKLASDHFIVTPISGAVVLENARQFKDAGLTPMDADQIPVIPEPEVWILIIIVIFMTFVILARQRKCRKLA